MLAGSTGFSQLWKQQVLSSQEKLFEYALAKEVGHWIVNTHM